GHEKGISKKPCATFPLAMSNTNKPVTSSIFLQQKGDPIDKAVETTIGLSVGNIIAKATPYPQYIKELYEDAHFMDNIRAYNQMFSMTSLGPNIDKSITNGKGPYVFRISGQYTKTEKRMSMNMYYSYQIHDRLNHYNLLLRGGKLFQQYVVTAYCTIEQSRLDHIRQKQDDIRSEYLSGSPRYMYAHYLDALAICRDEAPTNDRRCFEALDRSLKDICNRPNTFFGGVPDETDTKNTFAINIPPKLCIPDSDAALAGLIEFIYDEKTLQTPTPKDLQNKAIVCPKNEDTDMINAEILALVNHQQHMYLSFDDAVPHGNDGDETELLYPAEYLNSLNFVGFPPHRLELKVGAPIILLWNLNISGGLCNGTRLIVTQLLSKVIEGNAIQANMDLKDTDYFSEPLQLNDAYMISTYNEVEERATKSEVPLTDYTGCVYRISDPLRSGDATRTRRVQRIIDVQNLKYCFKAIINDGTATATVTCFSPEAHTFVPDCNTIVNTIKDKDTTHVPTVLTQTEGHTYIFQYRFGYQAKPGYPNFTLDVVLQPVTKPLLALPVVETIKSPATQVLKETSIGNNATTTNEGPSEFGKPVVESPSQIPEEKAKKQDTAYSKILIPKGKNQGKMPK
nr:DNA helicase [Tanacetum cinerariifolium]